MTELKTMQLPLKYKAEDYTPIDLSVSNEEIQNVDASSSIEWEKYINTFLDKNGKKVAYGGYLERRNLYQRSDYFKNDSDNRNIHLGVDFWAPAETEILAIYDGKVHSFQNNMHFGDYGPTIILEHNFEGETLYSLYGHLNEKSLENLSVGKEFKSGEVLGWLGDASVNGDYAPHLHLQLIRNMEGKSGDYPGVCSIQNLEWFSKNCLNPLNFMKL